MKANVNITKKDIQSYMFYSIYRSFSGIASIVLGLLTVAGGVFYLVNRDSSGILFLVIALMFFIIQPALIFMQSAAQSKAVIYKQTTYYEFDENELRCWQDGVEPAHAQWQNIHHAVKNGSAYYIFFDKIRANIIPGASFEGNGAAEFEALMSRVLPKQKRKGFK